MLTKADQHMSEIRKKMLAICTRGWYDLPKLLLEANAMTTMNAAQFSYYYYYFFNHKK